MYLFFVSALLCTFVVYFEEWKQNRIQEEHEIYLLDKESAKKDGA